MSTILLHLLPASFYLALTLIGHLPPARQARSLGLTMPLLLAALLSHAFVLGHTMFGQGGFQFGLTIALSLTLWIAMLVYSLESMMRPLKQLLTYAAPVAMLFSALPGFSPGFPQTIDIHNWAFRLHILVAMLAYSLFTLAVFHALLMTAAERHLHGGSVGAAPSLPPLLTLERLLFRLIHTAFVFLTLTVMSGVLFSEEIFGKPFTISHKAIFGLASWILFAILLLGRHYYGWRGKTATRLLLAGFACLVLAYAGTRFVIEYLLHRSI